MFEGYLDLVSESIGRIKETQKASIRSTAKLVADTISEGGSIRMAAAIRNSWRVRSMPGQGGYTR